MPIKKIALAGAIAVTGLSSLVAPTLAQAQAAEQFIALLVYRTGQFAPLGIPWADGKQDYLKLVNARDGGVNGVKLTYEECETAYDAAKGVECYERLKSKGSGASGFDPQSTGITFAVTDKAFADKVSIETPGYGLSQSVDGTVFEWNFPLLGTYWTAADVILQDIAKKEKGSLKGKKIGLVYHDSPYGKEPIPLLEKRAAADGFEVVLFPVTPPGVEQKSTWLKIRQQKPDYVLFWSAGVMTPAGIREAQATAFPREKMYAVWWAGSDHDVKDLGISAKGYNAVTIHNSAAKDAVHDALKTMVYDKGQGTGPATSVGTLAHTRGMMISMLQVEAIRAAQEKYGKGKSLTSEQVRWGFENLNLTAERLKALGFGTIMRPVKTSCSNHMGDDWARIVQWDGGKWNITSDWYQSDKTHINPLVKEYAAKYAKEKNITPRTCN
ncbi:ABC transporter substrate-binding protein [Rhodoferax antarcticus]|uniref:Branched-chain amino acid ABC transporter n=1 Tax=Rhodoferax antarcticus ANT.BR TaxID=1111071 RepID=A0A1Q8YIY3_9BURK|nr:ABC transporter substrate-binding protein [Rhodoferax antarcticus]APW47801.1 ABC transporter permease [Rhodoferax antarcticus]MCW2312367.1 branched-chain amino acid transport system substrate-binding protein [Rhodoferax antarcticus]OLP08021.1 branched-chain amino acid ABC transporter [Rhodoferax antarcticus ANT.BR]